MAGALLERLGEARTETDKLFDLVKPEFLYERPIPERHRLIFYLGHLEAFDWNLLQPRLPGVAPFDASSDKLFAFGIDPVEGGLPTDTASDWPAEQQVRNYRRRVREALDHALATSRDWGNDQTPETLLNVAIEHRLMHAETLAYLLHQLPSEGKLLLTQPEAAGGGPVKQQMIEIPAGPVTLGLSREEGEFGWDNEFEKLSVDVPAFQISRYKVTNGEFSEFLRAGGYRDRSLWTEGDWRWIQENGISNPIFWKPCGDQFIYKGMFEEIPLPLDWPVFVSHAEARAYCAWRDVRLPTEAEWQRAAEQNQLRNGFYDMQRWDPSPVNAFPGDRSHWGLEGLQANGWEWTSSLFEPFPGFEPFPFYRGYSAEFFDGKHYVQKGGSPRTARTLLRPSFRNWFQPHYQYVYAGFRYVKEG